MMNAGRPPQPTTEQRRDEETRRKRADRLAAVQKHFSGAGHATRATASNMLAVFATFPEWQGVFTLAPNVPQGAVPQFAKRPPLHQDVEGADLTAIPRPVDLFHEGGPALDLVRIAIWFEREAQMIIETPSQFAVLAQVIRIFASQRPTPA